jgi:hypothetical protein
MTALSDKASIDEQHLHNLRIGLVQEGVGWFEEAGDSQLNLTIHVTDDV